MTGLALTMGVVGGVGAGVPLRYRNVWITFLGCGAISGPTLAFSGLWGMPLLVQQYGMTPQSAALVTSILLIAWAIAGPFAGLISDRTWGTCLPARTCNS